MKRIALTLIAGAMLSGCLAKQLRTPAEDHYVQAKTIADACRDHELGDGICTQEMLDAMADQANCIRAAVNGTKCEVSK